MPKTKVITKAVKGEPKFKHKYYVELWLEGQLEPEVIKNIVSLKQVKEFARLQKAGSVIHYAKVETNFIGALEVVLR